MALSKIDAVNFLTGTIPSGNIATSSLAAAATGKVLQVVTVTDSTTRSTTSTSFTQISSFDLAITPSAASSKIFLSFSGLLYKHNSGGTGFLTFYRDSTDLSGGAAGFGINDGDGAYDGSTGMSYLDSPNTTSQVTYKIYLKTGGSGTVEIANASALGSFTAFEIGA
jgi:hypothetical protein